MTAKFRRVFGQGKPVVAMVHFGALPGSPLVGSSLKVDGNTWNPVDPDRAVEFMRLARAARGK